MTKGFCHAGALASPRVGGLADPIARLFTAPRGSPACAPTICHKMPTLPGAGKSEQFPEHCVVGTEQARTIEESLRLPCAPNYRIIPKNSLSATAETELDRELARLDEAGTTTYIATGDAPICASTSWPRT